MQVSLKPANNKGYFTWISMYISNKISLNSSQNEKNFRKICRAKSKHIFLSNNVFRIIVPFMNSRGKILCSRRSHRKQYIILQIRCDLLAVSLWLLAHCESVTLIALMRQPWILQHISMLRLHVHCLSFMFYLHIFYVVQFSPLIYTGRFRMFSVITNIYNKKIKGPTLTLRRLMSYIYIYGAPILDVSRSHTTTQHSR